MGQAADDDAMMEAALASGRQLNQAVSRTVLVTKKSYGELVSDLVSD